MPDLKYRQQKIQEKRKQTPWREFLKEICGWYSLNFYLNDGLFSKHPTTERRGNILDFETFSEERDSLTDYGKQYSSKQSFFEQFESLYREVPYPGLVLYPGCENCPYSDAVLESKNTYLCVGVIHDCENILYSTVIKQHCHNVLNCNWVINGQNIYLCKGVTNSMNIFYSKYVSNSNNIWFCTGLINCEECILCHDIENKKYCIRNIEYSKEDYLLIKKSILAKKEMYTTHFLGLPKTDFYVASENVLGENIVRSYDIENGYGIFEVKEGRNLISVGASGETTNLYDVYGSTPPCNHVYGCAGVGMGMEHAYCSTNITGGSNIYYSFFLVGCSYCLGCIGLKNKSFCIFNKQYTKEARHEKVDEIFQKMENTPLLTSPQGEEKRNINGDIVTELGAFFSGSMNPFYFNDTAAYLIDDSFTKEEVEAEGYLRRDEEVKVDIPEGMEVVKVSELGHFEGWSQTPPPDSVGDLPLSGETNVGAPLIRGGGLSEAKAGGVGKTRYINPTILDKVIQDEEGNVYRIVKMEYDFLVKHGLPLPRLHWLDRLKMNFKIQ